MAFSDSTVATESHLSDEALFNTSPDILLDSIRMAASGAGREITSSATYVLTRCGLLHAGELTAPGQTLFKLAWVLRKPEESRRALGSSVRQMTPIQVIEQELRGCGAVPEEGVLDLLRQHKAVGVSLSISDMRPTLRWLNGAGVLVYSMKLKTVRCLMPPPDAALAGETQGIASMISPRTPFLNVVRLRRIIRPLRGTIWWADPHFGARALEELAEELNTDSVSEIRILSGDAENVVSGRSMRDFQRFQQEMLSKGITAEWRIDARGVRDWHDRWLADNTTTWNVPPINTLFKNDYSEISPASHRPPLSEWWNRSMPRN